MKESYEQLAEQLEMWIVFAAYKRSQGGAADHKATAALESMEQACVAGAAALRRVERLDNAIAELTYLPGRKPPEFDALSAVEGTKANLQMLLDSLEEKEKKLSVLGTEAARLREAVDVKTVDCPTCEGWAETRQGNDCDACGRTGELVIPAPAGLSSRLRSFATSPLGGDMTELAIAAMYGATLIDGISAALTNTPATASWLQAHDAEVRRKTLVGAYGKLCAASFEAQQGSGVAATHFQFSAVDAMRLIREMETEDAAQPAKEGRYE